MLLIQQEGGVMKIINDLGIKRYENNPSKLKKVGTRTHARNFDEITIHGKEEVMDSTFARQCSDKLKKELRRQTPEEMIQDLRKKIENDEYRVDYDRLLRKIMLED